MAGFSFLNNDPALPDEYLTQRLYWYEPYKLLCTKYAALEAEHAELESKNNKRAAEVKKELDALQIEVDKVEAKMTAEALRGQAEQEPLKDPSILRKLYNVVTNSLFLSFFVAVVVAFPLLVTGAPFLGLGLGLLVCLAGLLLRDFYRSWASPKGKPLSEGLGLLLVVAAILIAVGTGFSLTTFISLVAMPLVTRGWGLLFGKKDYLVKPSEADAKKASPSRFSFGVRMLFGSLVTMGVGYFLLTPGAIPGFLVGVPVISTLFATRVFVPFSSMFSLFGQGASFLGGIPTAFIGGLVAAGPFVWAGLGVLLLLSVIFLVMKAQAVSAEMDDISQAKSMTVEMTAKYGSQSELEAKSEKTLESEPDPANKEKETDEVEGPEREVDADDAGPDADADADPSKKDVGSSTYSKTLGGPQPQPPAPDDADKEPTTPAPLPQPPQQAPGFAAKGQPPSPLKVDTSIPG